jgi:metallo-beta-lactamase class B
MLMIPSKIFPLLVVITFACLPAQAQKVTEPQNTDPKWSQPYHPFQIVGNLYYVGSHDLACYLVVTPAGNILINTGLAGSVSMIRENIEHLGFKLADTKILLTTQAHYDHVAAMAAVKQLTGAKMMVDKADAGVLADGGSSDYALGGNGRTYEPVKIDRLLKDGDKVTLGNMQLVLLHHPGHTKGSCSYLFNVKDGAKTYKVLIANMPSIVTSKKFSDISSYPTVAEDYAYTFKAMKNLSFDIWLASHASQFGMHEKRKPGDPYNPAAFVDRPGYDVALKELEEAYLLKIKNE